MIKGRTSLSSNPAGKRNSHSRVVFVGCTIFKPTSPVSSQRCPGLLFRPDAGDTNWDGCPDHRGCLHGTFCPVSVLNALGAGTSDLSQGNQILPLRTLQPQEKKEKKTLQTGMSLCSQGCLCVAFPAASELKSLKLSRSFIFIKS